MNTDAPSGLLDISQDGRTATLRTANRTIVLKMTKTEAKHFRHWLDASPCLAFNTFEVFRQKLEEKDRSRKRGVASVTSTDTTDAEFKQHLIEHDQTQSHRCSA